MTFGWFSSIGPNFKIVLSQYTSITLPIPIVLNGGWSSMSLYIEKGLMITIPSDSYPRGIESLSFSHDLDVEQ